MKKIILLIIVGLTINGFAQQANSELSPELTTLPESTTKTDTFNLQFSFPCTAFIGEYGVESDGVNVYVSQWLDDSIAKYDVNGNVIETFVIDGVGRVRDMAYDGEYYYGSPRDYYFYVMDMENKTLLNTINTSVEIRGMAYDIVEDELWASENWTTNFIKMDMSGNVLDTWSASNVTYESISGIAFDNDSDNGPFLWGFSQEGSGALIVKHDIATQSQTGSVIDVSGLANDYAIAGGLFMNDMQLKSAIALGGVLQNDLVFAFELSYANSLVSVEDNFISQMKIYPNPANDFVNIELGDSNEPVDFKFYDATGKTILINSIRENNYTINTSDLETGIYFLELSQKGNFSITKKIMVK